MRKAERGRGGKCGGAKKARMPRGKKETEAMCVACEPCPWGELCTWGLQGKCCGTHTETHEEYFERERMQIAARQAVLCPYFLRGRCRYGSACWRRHGDSDSEYDSDKSEEVKQAKVELPVPRREWKPKPRKKNERQDVEQESLREDEFVPLFGDLNGCSIGYSSEEEARDEVKATDDEQENVAGADDLAGEKMEGSNQHGGVPCEQHHIASQVEKQTATRYHRQQQSRGGEKQGYDDGRINKGNMADCSSTADDNSRAAAAPCEQHHIASQVEQQTTAREHRQQNHGGEKQGYDDGRINKGNMADCSSTADDNSRVADSSRFYRLRTCSSALKWWQSWAGETNEERANKKVLMQQLWLQVRNTRAAFCEWRCAQSELVTLVAKLKLWGLHRWKMATLHRQEVRRRAMKFNRDNVAMLAMLEDDPFGEATAMKAMANDANGLAHWAVSSNWLERQVEIATEQGQSTMAFGITEIAMAMKWCYRWREVKQRLLRRCFTELFYVWLFGARNSHAFDMLCERRMIFGLESRQLFYHFMFWMKEALNCKIRVSWRQNLWQVIVKRSVRRWAKAVRVARVCVVAASVIRIVQIETSVKLVFKQWRRAWFGSLSKAEEDRVIDRRDRQRKDCRRA